MKIILYAFLSICCACTGLDQHQVIEKPLINKDLDDSSITDVDVECKIWPFAKRPPYYLSTSNIVVTRVMKTCSGPDGEFGFEYNSSWLAMGFPCSGGGGKISIRGKSYKPKKISFQITNSCPMNPSDLAGVKQAGVVNVGFSEAGKLLAYYPYSVQFWELISFKEADIGFEVALWTQESLKEAWKQIKLGNPLRVRLFGREDGWVRGDRILQVEAEISLAGGSGFVLKVLSAVAVNPEELKGVIDRCSRYRGQSACSSALAI